MDIKWFKHDEKDHNNEPRYSLDSAKEKFEVRELDHGWLVLHKQGENSWIDFAVFEFSSSNLDGTNTLINCIFHGTGPSGGLRECHHTWWGNEGYVFYPNGRIILEAFKELSEFFDDMV